MELLKAKAIAEKYLGELKSFCLRISVAGSIRREKPEVKDIELVCIPNTHQLINFSKKVNEWQKVKGKPTGKYTQRLLPEGIKLDLFIATLDNWGLQFAIRTGSAEFSHRILACGWVKAGYHSQNGILYDKENNPKYIHEEKDLFDLIGLEYIEPKYRIFDN
jgi:DNA polymerase/3'-5' exonuclease PolX